MKTSVRPILTLLGLTVCSTSAAPLKEGELTKVINEVRILPVEASPFTAKPGDRISGRTAVSTGAQSRAELRFSDNTLTRLGANSIFRMDQATRTVDLEKGVILLQVPKQLGGAKVRTAAITAAVTGTTLLLEFTPDGFVKIIVIEGEVDVSLNERRSQFRTLGAGDMWISRASDKQNLPLPVQVDLERLKKTSKLLNADEFGPLGNQKQLQGALKEQGDKKLKGDLTHTAFQIEGRGRNVTLLLADRQHLVLEKPAAPVDPPPNKPTNKPTNIPGTTQFDDRSIIDTFSPSNAYNSVAGGFVPLPGTKYNPDEDGQFGKFMFGEPQAFSGLDELLAGKGTWFAMKGDAIYIAGSPSVDSSIGPKNLILGATGDVSFTANPPFDAPGNGNGDTWTLDDNTRSLVFAALSGSINFDSFNLLGIDQDVAFHADGLLSDVNILGLPSAQINLPEGTFEAIAGRNIRILAAAVEAKSVKLSAGRDLELGAAKLAAAGSISLRAKQRVKISDSSELRSLSKMGDSQVVIDAINGGVDLRKGSSVAADRVSIASERGDVRLVNSSIAAREIKARVFDSGGTLLLSNAILGRGTNVSDLIRIYGEGAQGVRFVGDTTLRGSSVDIAGSSVSIDFGSLVRLADPAGTTVYAKSHNYNLESTGKFSGLNGVGRANVNQKPYSKRPKF